MTDDEVTPGQLAYEAWFVGSEDGGDNAANRALARAEWRRREPEARAWWEAGAQAAIAPVQAELDELRGKLAALAKEWGARVEPLATAHATDHCRLDLLALLKPAQPGDQAVSG